LGNDKARNVLAVLAELEISHTAGPAAKNRRNRNCRSLGDSMSAAGSKRD
jgi:hypothetical protein